MIEWFLSLDKAAQAALASGVVSSVVVGVIAVLGFWITFRTSTAANREIAEITKSSKTEEFSLSCQIKIAEFKEKRVQEFRDAVSEYISFTPQVSTEMKNAERQKLRLRVDFLAIKIRLMLDMSKAENLELMKVMYEEYEFAFNQSSSEKKKHIKDSEDRYDRIIRMSHDIMMREWNEVLLTISNQPQPKESN